MKKIYYQRNKTKVTTLSTKKLRTYTIRALDYEDAYNQLLSKHLNLSKAMTKSLAKIFSMKENRLTWASNLNSLLGQLYIILVNLFQKYKIRILSVVIIMGITNYLVLSWIRTNVSHVFYQLVNFKSLIDYFMKVPLIVVIFCIMWLLFLIPKKKYNVISMFCIIFADLVYFWIDRDSYVYFDNQNSLSYIKIGEGTLENIYFFILSLLTSLVVSFIVFNILDEIYKWLVGINKRIEAPKLSLIWAIIAFLLGVLLK